MEISKWLPVLSMISAFVGLFVDYRNEKSRWRWLIPLFIVLSGVGTIVAGIQADADQAKSSQAKAEADTRRLEETILAVNGHTDDTLAPLKALFGLSGAKSEVVAKATTQELNDYARTAVVKQQAVSKLQQGDQSSLLIQYFPHFATDVNLSAMVSALKQVSPNVSEAKPTENMSQQTTNCIWIGDGVSPEETRAVALTLASAGIGLKDIRRLKNGSGGRARLVQIGSSVDAARLATLSSAEIERRTAGVVLGSRE